METKSLRGREPVMGYPRLPQVPAVGVCVRAMRLPTLATGEHPRSERSLSPEPGILSPGSASVAAVFFQDP